MGILGWIADKVDLINLAAAKQVLAEYTMKADNRDYREALAQVMFSSGMIPLSNIRTGAEAALSFGNQEQRHHLMALSNSLNLRAKDIRDTSLVASELIVFLSRYALVCAAKFNDSKSVSARAETLRLEYEFFVELLVRTNNDTKK